MYKFEESNFLYIGFGIFFQHYGSHFENCGGGYGCPATDFYKIYGRRAVFVAVCIERDEEKQSITQCKRLFIYVYVGYNMHTCEHGVFSAGGYVFKCFNRSGNILCKSYFYNVVCSFYYS